MSAKPIASSPRSLPEINKQIIEIKKKIQLSEGQRKAAFELYETERKQNADKILKLKKEIKDLVVALRANKDENAAYRIQIQVQRTHATKLETLVGPLANKTVEQVRHALDLLVIDQRKQLDLIRHKIKQKEMCLATLAKEYQTLISEEPNKDINVKIDNPFKQKICTLQNDIHRVEVQWYEAEHVKKNYLTIKTSLMADSGRFESGLKQLEERFEAQQQDISYLQKINAEAAKSRSSARTQLQREESSMQHSAKLRDRQNAEYTNLIAERKLELERLERKIFQAGKPTQQPRPEIVDDTEPLTAAEEETTPEKSQEEMLKESFEKLKEITGASNTDEVLARFRSQQETKTRLDLLKKSTEEEKHKLELKQETLSNELEGYKYAKEKEKEKHSDNITELKQKIEEQQKRKENILELCSEKQSLLETICKILYNLYTGCLNETDSEIADNKIEHGEKMIELLSKYFQLLIEQNEQLQNVVDNEKVEEEVDEKNPIEEENEEMLSDVDSMPHTYNILLRRTPVPGQTQQMQISTPVPITASEDEEEVPSRGFLKRQAQLVVDTKLRRKNIRIPIPRK